MSKIEKLSAVPENESVIYSNYCVFCWPLKVRTYLIKDGNSVCEKHLNSSIKLEGEKCERCRYGCQMFNNLPCNCPCHQPPKTPTECKHEWPDLDTVGSPYKYLLCIKCGAVKGEVVDPTPTEETDYNKFSRIFHEAYYIEAYYIEEQGFGKLRDWIWDYYTKPKELK